MDKVLEHVLSLLPCVLVIATWTHLKRIHQLVQNTTATHACRWAQAAIVTLLFAGLLRSTLSRVPLQLTSALTYSAAVMLLTPLIAILGARRPGASAWPWFVVLPMVVVLQWPSLSQLASGQWSVPIEIPSPTALGFLFVMVMGAGNYFGTEVTGAAFTGCLAVLAFLLPSTEWTTAENNWMFTAGSVLLLTSSYSISARVRQRLAEIDADTADVQLLWQTFRDLFGIVWAKRVMDRVNQFAERENWDTRLSLDGFIAAEQPASAIPVLPGPRVPHRPVKVLCWVLRRFMDESFLQQFVSQEMTTSLTEASGPENAPAPPPL